ncbi:MAG: hypothetical protein ABIT04_04665 [Novosphingobium sp.]
MVAAASLAVCSGVHGQTLPSREQAEPTKVPEAQPPGPAVSIEDQRALPQDDCALARSDIRVDPTAVHFEGAGGGGEISPVLRPLLQELQPGEAGDQPINVVCRIRDRVNGALAQAGYIARVHRAGIHPERELARFAGFLQADAYSGFSQAALLRRRTV